MSLDNKICMYFFYSISDLWLFLCIHFTWLMQVLMSNLRESNAEDLYSYDGPSDDGYDESMRGMNDPSWDLWEEWMGWEGAGIRDYSSHINPYIWLLMPVDYVNSNLLIVFYHWIMSVHRTDVYIEETNTRKYHLLCVFLWWCLRAMVHVTAYIIGNGVLWALYLIFYSFAYYRIRIHTKSI